MSLPTGLGKLYAVILLAFCLAGCAAAPAAPAAASATPDLRQAAAAQATAIVQQAEATALIQQAQTRAAMLLAQPASTLAPGPTPRETPLALPSLVLPPPRPVSAQAGAPAAQNEAIVIIKVSLASETGLILVQFHAPFEAARGWFPGNLSLINEATGQVYNEVPVLPIVGPLIGRPRSYDQVGYFMLSNAPAPEIKVGDLVTILMGNDYKKEHLVVEP